MDHALLMFLAALGAIGWLVGALKRHAQVWTRLGVIPAFFWLTVYFFIELARAEPGVISGVAQVSIATLALMIGGVWALLADPRHRTDDDDHGGARSA